MNSSESEEGKRAGGPILICSIAVLLTILGLIFGWLYSTHWQHWCRVNGKQLPSLTLNWMTPMWHVVAGTVVMASALAISLRKYFVVGVGVWIVVGTLYVAFTALAVYGIRFSDDGPLGSPPGAKPTHWYWP